MPLDISNFSKSLDDPGVVPVGAVRPGSIIVLGASIEQNEGNDWSFQGPYGSNVGSGALGPIQWASAFTGGKLRLVKNCGIAGLTSTQMLAFIQNPANAQCAINVNPAPGFVYLGHVTGDDPGLVSAQQSADNDLAFYQLMRKTYPQAVIVLATLPGVNIPPGTGNWATRALVNSQRRLLALQNPNTLLFDFEGLYTNPLTGLPVVAYSQDQIHPNPAGAMVLGQALAAVLGPVLPAASGFVNDYANDSRVSVANGGWTIDALMRGAPGAGVTATNWIFSGFNGGAIPAGSTRNLIARPDQYGNWQEMVLGGTAGVVVCYRSIPVNLPAGAVMQAECELQFRGTLASNATDISLILSNNSGFTLAALGNQQANQGAYIDPGANVTLTVRTPPGTVPAGGVLSANTFFQMSINSGVATTGSVRFGRASLIRLS